MGAASSIAACQLAAEGPGAAALAGGGQHAGWNSLLSAVWVAPAGRPDPSQQGVDHHNMPLKESIVDLHHGFLQATAGGSICQPQFVIKP